MIHTLLFTLGALNAFGQWEACGNGLPLGVHATDLVSVGNELLITTGAQVYRSGILGDNWTISSSGLPLSDQEMNCLAVHQSRVFCGSDSVIYYSDDNGLSWAVSLNTGFKVIEFAETSSALFAVTNGSGCLKSTDNGLSWQAAGNGLQTDTLTNILAVGNRLYIGSRYYGLYVSEDVGDTWASLSIGQVPINVLEIISDGSDIYVGLREWPHGSHYISKSSDWGSSWTQINSSAFAFGSSILASTGICIGSTVLFAGEQVFLGSDYGSSWEIYSQGSSFPYNSFHATDQYVFLASGDFFSPELLYRRPISQILDVVDGQVEIRIFELYPNPANNILYLKFPASISSTHKITIANQMGEVVFIQEAEGNKHQIPIEHINAGAYVLSVSMADGSLVNQRLIVQR